jgi:hypothetical protein
MTRKQRRIWPLVVAVACLLIGAAIVWTQRSAVVGFKATDTSATEKKTNQTIGVLESAAQPTLKFESNSALSGASNTVDTLNASWLSIQREANLRPRIGQALISNKQEEAAAALNAVLYCSTMTPVGTASTAETADGLLMRFPGDKTMFLASPAAARGAVIDAARAQCAYGAETLPKEAETALRQGLAKSLDAVNSLVKTIQRLPEFDWSSLTATERGLLESGRLDVYSRIADGLAGRWGTLDGSAAEYDAIALVAAQLALCKLGDACDTGSFRFANVCVTFGACEGANVDAAVRRLIIDEAARARAEKLADMIVVQLTRNSVRGIKK